MAVDLQNLNLKRYPIRKSDPLQAWNSADELLVDYFTKNTVNSPRILILNDSFGALCAGLLALNPQLDLTTYTDSYVGARGIELNCQSKHRAISDLGLIQGHYDWILIQTPKNLSFFEDQLCRLTAHIKANTKVVCGYRMKHHAKGAFELLEKIIGPTQTSLAQKKARLIHAHFERSPSATRYPIEVNLDGYPQPFLHHSGIFSREKLDIGTRFFLEHVPKGNFTNILDLGCANGIIGIAAKQANPSARIHFSDDSWMAVESARENYRRLVGSDEKASFYWTHCFENQPQASIDLVLCNPPFHQGNTVGDSIAKQMFRDAHHALVPGGKIRVIGNHHLGYPEILKRLFGESQVIARNNKFTIVDATRS